jgi:hypothetical protein
MTPSPESGEQPPASAKGLSRAAHLALLVSVLGAGLDVQAVMAHERAGDSIQRWGLGLGMLGMALSLGTVLIGIAAGHRAAGETLVDRSPSLLLPYLLIQPLCWFQAMGLGLGGDSRGGGSYGFLSLTAIVLGAMTFVVILWKHLRSRA